MARYRIGRADTNDIVLSDATISREHAELVELGGGRFRLKDFGSSYGTSVFLGQDWEKVTEMEIRHDTQIRLGEFQTTAAELLRETDKTVVRARSDEAPAPSQPSAPSQPPAAAKTAPPAPPKPPPPKPPPPRPAAPSESGPSLRAGPAAPSEASSAPSQGTTAPPRPPAPGASPLAFMRDLPPEKRTLVWLGTGFAAFLLVSLITLILALVL
ncbi:MAG TPA: FHA domain-containing protein [Alphaproteobacteria bacterium]|jgi:predicted component of type VI protein secretion system